MVESSNAEGKYYSNKLARLYLSAIEDIMGGNGFAAALRLAGLDHLIGNYPPDTLDREFSFEDYAAVNHCIAEMYGPQGAKGLCLRAGRAALHEAITEGGLMADVPDPAFNLLPVGAKLKVGLKNLADVLSKLSDQEAHLEDQGGSLLFVIEHCPECWGRASDGVVCHASTGMVQEALRWLSDSDEFCVAETECVAKGDDACVFAISERPTEEPPDDGQRPPEGADTD